MVLCKSRCLCRCECIGYSSCRGGCRCFCMGYLTRYTDAPDGLRWSFILICLFFLIFYFVWYPSFRSRFFKFQRNETIHMEGNGEKSFEKFAIHSNEAIVRESFQGIWGKGWLVLGLSLLYTILISIVTGKQIGRAHV